MQIHAKEFAYLQCMASNLAKFATHDATYLRLIDSDRFFDLPDNIFLKLSPMLKCLL